MSLDSLDDFDDGCFKSFIKVIYEYTGISISENRKVMVQGRLRKRVTQLKLKSYQAYLEYLKTQPSEKPNFIDLVTTNETTFFRTPRIWQYIEKTFLPEWFMQNPTKTFRVWSAAASSGEEAYSLASILYTFKQSHPAFKFSILGTDISGEMVDLCRKGVYRGRSVESYKIGKPDLFSMYLQRHGDAYSVASSLRSHVRFERHNLFEPLKSSDKFDLILVRNVFIYFKAEDQEKILGLMHPKLEDQGLIMIGESETLNNLKCSFQKVENLIYRKVSTQIKAAG